MSVLFTLSGKKSDTSKIGFRSLYCSMNVTSRLVSTEEVRIRFCVAGGSFPECHGSRQLNDADTQRDSEREERLQESLQFHTAAPAGAYGLSLWLVPIVIAFDAEQEHSLNSSRLCKLSQCR